MIKLEKRNQIIGLPFYYLKLIFKKFTNLKVNATRVACFDNYDQTNEFLFEKEDEKIFQSKFQIYDEITFNSLKTINVRLKKKKSVKFLSCEYLEVINKEGLPVDRNNNIILDGYYKKPLRNGKLKKIGFFQIKYHANLMLGSFLKPKKSSNYKNALIITSRWSENYYHWMTDIIPRLSMINKLNLRIDIVIINNIVNQFQKDTLRFIDLKEKIIETKNKHIFEIHNGIIPELDNLNSLNIDFLRKRFKKLMIKNSPTYIYVSRVSSKVRKIKNEKEFKHSLEKFGIKTVKLEKENFEQQVNLFYNARLIISTHGAGLTNLTFAQPGTKVIEFIPEKRFAKHYVNISNILNLKHYIIQYKGDSNYNLKVNINNFELFLSRIMDIQ